MAPSRQPSRISPSDFEYFANEVTMAVWNRLAELPQFHHLELKDYPVLYETLLKVLRRYRVTE